MAKERFELSDGVKDLLSGMGKLSAEMKDNSAKAMEYAQSMDKLAKQNTELTKLNEALSTSFSKVSNALNKASSGNDLTKYIKSQEDMVKSINRTYRQYSIQSDTIKKNQLAEELYKQVNALRAVTDNVDLSNLVGNFEEVKKAISSVGSYIKSEFSVSAFKEINETIEVLEQAGLKIKNVFSTLDRGSQFYDIDRELRETKKQLDLINNTDISELTGKLKKLGEIAEDEFNTFLNLYNLSGSSYKFYDIFEEIRSGAITSQQAIERVKNEFEYLLVEAKSSGNQNYDVLNSSAIREMVENISTLRIKVDEIMTRVSNVHGDTTGIKIFDEEQFSRLLILFEKIESSLSSMKAVFVDVGDGEEFSPLLKMINNVQESVNKLSSSVKGIGLNMNIDVGSDSEMEAKVQSKISNALQAYQRLFDHIKMSSAGGAIINTKFFDFDINQYDTMMAKLQAYKKFIENMRKEAKTQFNGKDVLYQDTDKSYWTAASAAMAQVTKAFNEIKASSDTNPLENLFGGKTDLTEVVSQLNLIVNKLGEISTTASEFKNIFANGLNVSTSVEEIEKLTSRVKELENELSKVTVSSTSPVETNISSPIEDTFQGDAKSSAESSAPAIKEEAKAMEQVAENAEKASKGKEKFAKANKNVKASADASTGSIEKENSALDEKVWEKNLKVIQEYMDANTKLNNLNAKDKGTGKHASDIARQEKEVEKLRESAIEARAALSSMVNPHEAPIDDWGKWIEAMEKFEQATKGSAESVAKLEDALRSARNAQLSSLDSVINNGQFKFDEFSARKAQSDAYKNSLKELGEKLEQLRTLKTSLSNTRAFTETEQQQINTLTQSVRTYIKEISRMSADEKGSSDISRFKLLDRIAEYMKKNTRMSREFKAELESLMDTLRTGGANVQTGDILTQFEKIKDRIRQAKQEGTSFFDIFKNKAVYGAAARLAQYYLSFYDFIRYARYAVNALVELDTALVDLRKTTSMTENQLEDFYYASNDVAKQMGVTTAEIINQASAWSRLGFSTKEASTEMAKLSAQFAAISPGMDLDTSTDGLVSTMKAFGIEVEDVERRIMDNINRIGNTAATDNAEIVDMLTRSSAAMAVANNTLEETIALETSAVEITRSAETTGTAFKTLSMRIRGYDEETEELSEDLENISGEIADLTKTAKTPGGISLFSDKDKQTYKSTYQILKEISEIYDDLSDKQQAELLEKLAGKRGGQVVASILTNFDAAEKALREMEDAAGSADAEMSIIEDSLEYKINALKQTWVGVAQEMIDRGDFGKVIDGLVKLSEAIGFVLDKAGLLGTAGLIGGGILSVKNAGICV